LIDHFSFSFHFSLFWVPLLHFSFLFSISISLKAGAEISEVVRSPNRRKGGVPRSERRRVATPAKPVAIELRIRALRNQDAELEVLYLEAPSI
jgi:hypothetical protein